ncbi:MAG: hypothetical protein Q8L64_05315 [bacterium]|nr:hypothetical protein [bacterium]
MHHLQPQDKADLARSGERFKIIVPLKALEAQCDTPILKELFENMVNDALRYAESVCRFQRIVTATAGIFDEQGERQAIEDVRGNIHDSFIGSVNILCRMMLRSGNPEKGSWRNLIGEDRAALGRFALTIAFEYIRRESEGGAT